MTSLQGWAVALYCFAAVFAIVGPGIAAARVAGKYRAAKKYKGTFNDFDDAFNPESVRANALREAAWGMTEFGFVALGVVLASVASILLVIDSVR